MCFSAPVSFSAAAALYTVGFLSLWFAKDKPKKLIFASTPFLFGIHQTIEGFVWLTITDSIEGQTPLSWIWTFIAVCFWPTFAPLCVLPMEKSQKRKGIIVLFLVLGIGETITTTTILIMQGVTVTQVGPSLSYELGAKVFVPKPVIYILVAVYFITTQFPFIVSGYKYMWLIGTINFIIGGVFVIVNSRTFFSVWCFFAAMISLNNLFFLWRPQVVETWVKNNKPVSKTLWPLRYPYGFCMMCKEGEPEWGPSKDVEMDKMEKV